MESFYVLPQYISGMEISIQGEEYHHLTRVLRKKTGDMIVVVNGTGTGYLCAIDAINRQEARCLIEKIFEQYNEPKVNAALMLPVLKNHNRIEWIVEKGTELGVRSFIPVYTERTVRHRIRNDRLIKIALAAMKQCKRSVLPEISGETTLNELLETAEESFDCIFVGHEEAPVSKTISGITNNAGRVLILAGPEGGFTGDEVKLCERRGARIVSLGLRRYRAETAAIIMAVCLIHD